MGMRPLHVHHALIFRSFEFRQMRMYCRSLPRMRVHVEKRSVEHRKEKSRYSAARRQSSHGQYSDAAGEPKSMRQAKISECVTQNDSSMSEGYREFFPQPLIRFLPTWYRHSHRYLIENAISLGLAFWMLLTDAFANHSHTLVKANGYGK